MLPQTTSIWQGDSQPNASGNLGAVHLGGGSMIAGIVSGIIFVIRNGLRWRDAPAAYGPHKSSYNRFTRWNRLGVFNRIFAELAAKGGQPAKKGLYPNVSGALKAKTSRSLRWKGPPVDHAAQRRANERLQRGGADD